MMTDKNSWREHVTPEIAFEMYLHLGEERTYAGLRRDLIAEYGDAPSARTIANWAAKYDWKDLLGKGDIYGWDKLHTDAWKKARKDGAIPLDPTKFPPPREPFDITDFGMLRNKDPQERFNEAYEEHLAQFSWLRRHWEKEKFGIIFVAVVAAIIFLVWVLGNFA